ncbi:MAG: patatin-like phospholipase family protein [Holosporales bacterium]
MRNLRVWAFFLFHLFGCVASLNASDPGAKDQRLYPVISSQDQPRKFNILSLDAGGGRAVIEAFQLAVLQELLQQYPPTKDTHIIDLFDAVAGSDMGGLLALYLTTSPREGAMQQEPHHPLEALRIFCFGRKKLYPRIHTLGTSLSPQVTYDTAKFDDYLASLWGDLRLKSCRRPVMIAGCTLRVLQHEGIGAKSDEPGWAAVPIVQVARMTTALPGIYEPETRIIYHSQELGPALSGALREPNPARFCLDFYTNLFMQKQQPTEMAVFSLGSGDTTQRLTLTHSQNFSSGPDLWDLLIKTRCEDTHHQLALLNQNDLADPGRKVRLMTYHRSQIQLDPEHAVLDHSETQTLAHLLSRAQQQVYQPEFIQLCEALLRPYVQEEHPLKIDVDKIRTSVHGVLSQLRSAPLQRADASLNYGDHIMTFYLYQDFRSSYENPIAKEENDIRKALHHQGRRHFFRMLFQIDTYNALTGDQVAALQKWIEAAKSSIQRHDQVKSAASKLRTLVVTGYHEKYQEELDAFAVGLKISQGEAIHVEEAQRFYRGYFHSTRDAQEIEDLFNTAYAHLDAQHLTAPDKIKKLKNLLDSCINLQGVFTARKSTFSILKDAASQTFGLKNPEHVGMHQEVQEKLSARRTFLEHRQQRLEEEDKL